MLGQGPSLAPIIIMICGQSGSVARVDAERVQSGKGWPAGIPGTRCYMYRALTQDDVQLVKASFLSFKPHTYSYIISYQDPTLSSHMNPTHQVRQLYELKSGEKIKDPPKQVCSAVPLYTALLKYCVHDGGSDPWEFGT